MSSSSVGVSLFINLSNIGAGSFSPERVLFVSNERIKEQQLHTYGARYIYQATISSVAFTTCPTNIPKEVPVTPRKDPFV